MYELYICGTDRFGQHTAAQHMMGTCLDDLVKEYKNKHPEVVHVILDVALDDTHLVVVH